MFFFYLSRTKKKKNQNTYARKNFVYTHHSKSHTKKMLPPHHLTLNIFIYFYYFYVEQIEFSFKVKFFMFCLYIGV